MLFASKNKTSQRFVADKAVLCRLVCLWKIEGSESSHGCFLDDDTANVQGL
jgi:hypothetical protein